MKPSLTYFALWFLVPILVFSAPMNVEAGQPRISGYLEKVDLDVGTVRLRLDSDAGGETKLLSLAKEQILVDINSGQEMKVQDIPTNTEITAVLSSTFGDVESIKIDAPIRRSILLAVDPIKRTVTIPGTDGRPEETLVLEKTAPIDILDESHDLAKAVPGMNVSLLLSLDRKSVYKMTAYYSSRYGDEGGSIVDINEATRTIQLLEGRGGRFRLHSFEVTENFRFYADRKAQKITLKDLPHSKEIAQIPYTAHVNVRVIPGTSRVLAIFARSHFLVGKVQFVDPMKRTLQVKLKGGVVDTFPIQEKAKIRVGDNRQATLDDLKPGREVGLRFSLTGEEVVFVGRPEDN